MIPHFELSLQFGNPFTTECKAACVGGCRHNGQGDSVAFLGASLDNLVTRAAARNWVGSGQGGSESRGCKDFHPFAPACCGELQALD
jgi:hypothetical protein